ncbi:MAG: flippase-like domain-containing protein [Chloroflexi bacterium]|nr:flippase-like domain-containing protein [Chloroflexota bacterium]
MLNRRRLWLGLAVSLVFLGLLLYRLDLGKMLRALVQANYAYLFPALAVYFVGFYLRAVRWRLLLAPMRHVASGRLFPVLTIGYMANNILPLRLGELVRAYFLGEQERVSKAGALGTIAAERIFDGLSLLLFLVVLAAVSPPAPWVRSIEGVMALLFGGALVVVLLALAKPHTLERLVSAFEKRLPARFHGRFAGLATRFLGGLESLRQPGQALKVMAVSLTIWVCESLMAYVLARSFSLGLGVAPYMMATAAANLAISLPSSSGGIGPFEFFAAKSLQIFGTDPEAATAFSIALHAALLVPVTLLGLAFLWWRNLSLSEALRRPAGEALANPSGGERH